MLKVNGFDVIDQAGAPGELATRPNLPEGMGAALIIDQATAPVKNSGAASATLTVADLIALALQNWASVHHGYGLDDEQHVVDDARTSDDLRLETAALTGRDYLVTDATGTVVEVRNYDPAGAGKITIAAGATTNVVMYLVKSAVLDRLGMRLTELAAGRSQMKQLVWQIERGTGTVDAANSIAISGTTKHVVYIDPVPAPDQITFWPRTGKTNLPGYEQLGPLGCLLEVYDANAASAASALTTFSLGLKRGSAQERWLHHSILLGVVTADVVLRSDSAEWDLTDTVTPLLAPEKRQRLRDFPFGQGLLRQLNEDLNPMKSRWVHLPMVTRAMADQMARIIMQHEGIDEMKLTTSLAEDGPDVASVSPLRILRPGEPDYDQVPGRLYRVGSEPGDQIPDHVVSAAAGVVKSSKLKAGAAGVVVAKLAGHVPGGVAIGGVPTKAVTNIASVISQSSGDVAHATAAENALRAIRTGRRVL